MAVFYIKTKNNDVYELTATTDVTFSHRNTNTKYPVESGASITDHVIVENSTFTLSGVITEVVNLNKSSPQKGIREYIEGLDALRKSKQPFTVFLDNKLKPYKNCLFTEFSGSKGVMEGLGSWRLNLSIEQVRFVDKATSSLVQVAPTSEEAGKNADGTSKDDIDAKKEEGSKTGLEKTFGRQVKEGGENFLKDKFGFGSDVDAVSGATP